MVADRVLNTDTQSDAILSQRDVHPLALEGARRLISRHAFMPVLIKSWGTPEKVYEDVQNSLMKFGYTEVMAEDMASKLVDHAIDHAEESRQKYGANIIALKIEVSQSKPLAQFETGAMEAQRIDGLSNQAQVAGATSVAIGFSTSGTTTTAARDSVGEILDLIAGKPAVWIHFEAPDKTELQGVVNEAAMSAISEVTQGGIDTGGGSVEDVAKAIETLELIQEQNLASPAIQALVENIVEMGVANTNAEPLKPVEIQQMADQTLEAASVAISQGEMPAEMAMTVIQLVSEMGSVAIGLGQTQTLDLANLMPNSQVTVNDVNSPASDGVEGAPVDVSTNQSNSLETPQVQEANVDQLDNHTMSDSTDNQASSLSEVGAQPVQLENSTIEAPQLQSVITANDITAEIGSLPNEVSQPTQSQTNEATTQLSKRARDPVEVLAAPQNTVNEPLKQSSVIEANNDNRAPSQVMENNENPTKITSPEMVSATESAPVVDKVLAEAVKPQPTAPTPLEGVAPTSEPKPTPEVFNVQPELVRPATPAPAEGRQPTIEGDTPTQTPADNPVMPEDRVSVVTPDAPRDDNRVVADPRKGLEMPVVESYKQPETDSSNPENPKVYEPPVSKPHDIKFEKNEPVGKCVGCGGTKGCCPKYNEAASKKLESKMGNRKTRTSSPAPTPAQK